MFLYASGMTKYLRSLRKKAASLRGTRIILTGPGQNQSHTLLAGAVSMIQQKKMVVFNIFRAVINGDCYQSLLLLVNFRASKIFSMITKRNNSSIRSLQ